MILNPKLLIVDDERGIVDMIQSTLYTAALIKLDQIIFSAALDRRN